MQRLGLDSTASPAQAAAVVATFDELQQHLREAEALRIRIEGIDRDFQQLEKEAQALAARAAGDLRDVEIEQIVAELRSRLQEARDKEARRADRLGKRERQERRRQEAYDAVRQATATVQTLCRLARCENHADLAAAAERSASRREYEGHLRSIGEQLLELAAGTPLEEFVVEAAQFDPAQVVADRDALDEQIKAAEQQQLSARDEIGRLEERQTGLRSGSSADLAAAATDTAVELLARIQHDAERYARLRLAAVILRKSIERYRDKNQGPVLQSASRLFEELTLGSFQGLRPDFDDDGRTVVRGQRDGGTLGAQALSDGTRDQLYLALRLASLQHYLDQHRPCPLLVDDILVHFDDQRAAAALTALADLAQRTQVIFFTHHEHLVRLAEAHLGPLRVHVQQLDCREASSTENTLAVASA
jgi:uncharacterized protein YhaN